RQSQFANAGYVQPWKHTNAKRQTDGSRGCGKGCELWGTPMNAPARPLRPFLRPAKAGHCFGRNELVWDGLQLRVGSKDGRVMAALEPDPRWPGMWRVRFGG